MSDVTAAGPEVLPEASSWSPDAALLIMSDSGVPDMSSTERRRLVASKTASKSTPTGGEGEESSPSHAALSSVTAGSVTGEGSAGLGSGRCSPGGGLGEDGLVEASSALRLLAAEASWRVANMELIEPPIGLSLASWPP